MTPADLPGSCDVFSDRWCFPLTPVQNPMMITDFILYLAGTSPLFVSDYLFQCLICNVMDSSRQRVISYSAIPNFVNVKCERGLYRHFPPPFLSLLCEAGRGYP